MRQPLLIATALILITGCEDRGEVACTDLAAISVTVNLTDEASGAAITDATVTFDADSQSDSCQHFTDGSYACGYEVDGDITVTVEKAGYLPVAQTVTVGTDECHVIGETLDIALSPFVDECNDDGISSSLTIEALSSHLGGTSPLTNATATYHVGNGAEQACEGDGSGRYICGWEQSGDIEWTLSAPGHSAAAGTETIELEPSGCHVQPKMIEVVLACQDC